MFVEECFVCQQNKIETIKVSGLLQPLTIPNQCWEEVSMDFIIGLPNSKEKSVIMVVVDRVPKYAHFVHHLIPLKLVRFLLHLWKQFKSYIETQ